MLSAKSMVRNVLGFVNFSNMIKLYTWRLRRRRNRVVMIFDGKEYTYGKV